MYRKTFVFLLLHFSVMFSFFKFSILNGLSTSTCARGAYCWQLSFVLSLRVFSSFSFGLDAFSDLQLALSCLESFTPSEFFVVLRLFLLLGSSSWFKTSSNDSVEIESIR